MSTIRESILSAIADGATNAATIAEATGFEVQQIRNNLYSLQSKGDVIRTADGLSLGAGRPPPKTPAHQVIYEAPVDMPPVGQGIIATKHADITRFVPRKATVKANGANHSLPEATPEPQCVAAADPAVAPITSGHHPAIVGLLATLPPAGAPMSGTKRAALCVALAAVIDYVYGEAE